ncbi:MAG: TetR family transcriptional regulator, partial [Verrucomicrobiota bacterium]
MPKHEPVLPDTRTRILDVAESLFSDHGFRDVSLRQITRAAEVNIASVNYHFGSKEALTREVLTRVIAPINQERLQLLDRAEHAAQEQGDPVPIEEILRALHRPVVNQLTNSPHHESVYLKLAGRCLAEPAENLSETLIDLFQTVITRFMSAVKNALPELNEADLFWRMHFSFGTMVYALTHGDRVALFSQGRVSKSDPEEILQRLIEFTAAGLRAEASVPAIPPEKPKSRPAKASLSIGLATLFLLSSCQSLSPPDSKYHTSVKAPAFWVASPDFQPAYFPDRDWVDQFRNTPLVDYVDSVLSNNRDLKAAQARIEVARANSRIVGSDLYPQIQGGLSGQRSLQNFIGFPFGTPEEGAGAAPSVISNRV